LRAALFCAFGQLRVFENVDGTGQVYVKDGAFPAGGGPNWENSCG
jgi:hypothetical protein